MIRAFLAIQPAADVILSLQALQHELTDAGADVRPVGPEALHLTIQFLGDVREGEMPEIERGLAESLRKVAPFDVECAGISLLPNQKRPRVVVAGLRGEGLAAAAESVETVLSPLGFPPEERAFKPHISVARVRSARAVEALVRFIKVSGERSFGTSTIDRLTLFRSQLRQDGAVYTPLATFPFEG